MVILREKEVVKEFPEKSRNFEATVAYNIGMIYDRLGKSQQALEYFEQLLSLNVKPSDPIDQAKRFNNICAVLREHGQNQRALDFCDEALRICREENVRKAFVEKSRYIEATVLQNIGDVYTNLGENQKALEAYNQALAGYQNKMVRDKFPEESSAGEATTYNQIGLIHHRLNRIELALSVFEKSLALRQGLGDFEGQSITLQNIGNAHTTLNHHQEAWDAYNKALAIAKNVDFRKASPWKSLRSEAATFKSMGDFQRIASDYQKALDFFKPALGIVAEKVYREAFPAESRKIAVLTYNDIGSIYDDAGQQQKSLEFYESALAILKEQIIREAFPLESRLIEAKVRNNIGTVSRKLCFTSRPANQIKDCYENQVLGSFKKVWEISRERELQKAFPRESLQSETTALNNIADSFRFLGQNQEALSVYSLALPLVRKLGDRGVEATILNNKGIVHADLRDDLLALDSYREALSLIQTVGDKGAEATTRSNLAVLYQQQGNLSNALVEVSSAINIIENLRGNFRDNDLKSSYFAGKQDIYQQKIDLLMQLHEKQPQKGYDNQALETSDRARARGLIELLTESRADIRKGIGDDNLLKREKDLQQKLDAAEKRRTQLSSNSATQAQATQVQQEIKDLYQAQNQLKNEIRKASPAYAKLKYPEPLKLAEIQKQLDPDTVLLQYLLGKESSYLWAVTQTDMTSYTLPKRSEIEKAATQFRDLLRDPGMQGVSPTDRQTGTSIVQVVNQLSTFILAPAAAELKRNRRIVIVADGALHTIPFAALTVPGSNPTTYNPLVKHHEIVNLPSASTIAILRETVTKNRKPALKTLALLADPVFSKEDDRFTGKLAKSPSLDLNLELERSALDRATRNLNCSGSCRLEWSGKEAKEILSLVPPKQQLSVTGFDATYEWATSPQLRQYRFLHFATHGLFDPKQPELSGLVFSRIDKQGNPRRDFLRLPDLFNLDLPAELIVLSACETGLGNIVQGEGIVGMTRGLMYAGTPRVVVSLWRVNDAATATLMRRFYEEIQQGKSPPVALQSAQQWMATQDAYQNPYSWAGFVVQGEWRWDAAVAKAATQ